MSISVIVAVYNVEPYLPRCIDSILSQTYRNFELILIDDGSPDNCGKICDAYADNDSRIVVIHQKNGGLSDARNAGIEWVFKNSNSEWLTFIDSDDWIDNRYLEILLNMATENHSDISVSNFLRTSGNVPSDTCDNVSAEIWDTSQFFRKKNLNATVAWGKLYKKSLFTQIRYPKGKLHEDEFTTYKILFACTHIAFTETPLYYYFINEKSITGVTWTPAHLVALEAFDERLFFFRQKKMTDLYQWQLEHYLFFLCDCCGKLAENQQYKTEYLSSTRKKLRLIIKDFEKTTHSRLPKDKEWIYDIAYPFERKIYWTVRGIISE